MKLNYISAEEFKKIFTQIEGRLDHLQFEWDRNDMASTNIFRDRLARLYLKQLRATTAIEDGFPKYNLIFDRRDETWRDYADQKLEPLLGFRAKYSAESLDLVLFRFWAPAGAIDPDSGYPTLGQVTLEYVDRLVSRPPFAINR